jgi:4-hydroxyproline epimerase
MFLWRKSAKYLSVRRALMFEPRGHNIMSGTILYPSSRDDCDVGVLFIEVSGCLPMCGHGTIGTVTAAIEEGLVVPRKEGRIAIEVPGLGALTVDLSYGGNFYVIIEPQANWAGLDAMTADEIVRLSPLVRQATERTLSPVHPEDDRIRGVSHVMWCDAPKAAGADARNAVFYGDKAIDRSPCGTGSSARMAQLVAKGRLAIGDTFVHESIIGTLFNCKVERESRVGSNPAILPSVAGWARVIGHNTIYVDDRDPLAYGFQLI